jgi:ribose transport system permease protein
MKNRETEEKSFAANLKPEIATALMVLIAAMLLILLMKIWEPSFGSVEQVEAILVTSIFLVIASYGQGLVILLGGIDLSIGVIMSISGMMIAGLTNGSNDALFWAAPITLIGCAAIGFVNGLGIAFLRIAPFIMTLAAGTTFFGVALGVTAGSTQRTVAPALQAVMSSRLLGLPAPILLIFGFLIIGSLLQCYTAEGRKLYAIGSNAAAARVIGLPIQAITVVVYSISGFCAGLAGLLLAGYSSSATLDMGDPFLMPAIAAVVIGGARVTGGKGIYLGTFAGAIFLSTLSTIITTLSFSQGWRNIIQGGVIVVALMLQSKQLNKFKGARRRLSGRESLSASPLQNKG